MPQLQPDNALGFLLTDVSRMFRQAFERAVLQAGLELTPGEIRTLVHASRHRGARQAVLAERMGVEPMTLSAYLGRLEARGLIERSVDPSDRRANMIQPTGQAERIFAEVRPVVERLYAEITAGMGEAEVEAVRAGLARIRDNLAAEGTSMPAPGEARSAAGAGETPPRRSPKGEAKP